MGERSRTCTCFNDSWSTSDSQSLNNVRRVWGVHDLCSVREGNCPKLRCRMEKMHKSSVLGPTHLRTVFHTNHSVVLEVAETSIEALTPFDSKRLYESSTHEHKHEIAFLYVVFVCVERHAQVEEKWKVSSLPAQTYGVGVGQPLHLHLPIFAINVGAIFTFFIQEPKTHLHWLYW